MKDLVTIYFFTDGTSIKIGRTKEIKVRQRNLQTSNSNPLVLLGVISNVLPSFEQHIHGICKDYNIQGEWFKKDSLYKHLLNHPFYRDHIKLEKVKENEGYI